MKRKIIHSEYLIEEMTTDGHSPLKFLCDDQEVYFCKYRTALDKLEINCLAYEFVCSSLLNELSIPTPRTELVTIGEGSLDPKKIKRNKHIRVGYQCFGSAEVKDTSILNDFSIVNTKFEFNRILNPLDLIKIAIFDLWVNNVDRGRQFEVGRYNYNLLIQQVENKEQIVAFDHGFTFGGLTQLGIFNPKISTPVDNKLHKTPYYQSVVRFVTRPVLLKIVDDFVHLLYNDYSDIISKSIATLPKEWGLLPNLEDRMIEYLSHRDRLGKIREEIIK